MPTDEHLIHVMSDKLDMTGPHLTALDRYFAGTQQAAFLTPKAAAALAGSFRALAVNFPRLTVTSLAERLTVAGFRTDGPDSEPDAELWRVWRRCGMEDASQQAHLDALVYGRAFALVWADQHGRPSVTIESPHQVAVVRDPATLDVTAAFKRWADDDGGHGVLYLPDRITRYRVRTATLDAAALPSTGWTAVETFDNPLGVVPVVPIVNRGRLLDVDGVSAMSDVLDLADAVNKLVADLLVTSEFYARPRRWATGIEIVEDDQGRPVQPFSPADNDVWLSESPDTKFGQFSPASLSGYSDAVALLTQQIGALTGLPPHYLGLHGDQPASADAIRSAEASLVARAYALHRTFGAAWAQVARLLVAVRDGIDPASVDVEVVWTNPETRTPAQAADAAAKLVGIGVPLSTVLADTLGLSPAEVERVMLARRADALATAGVDLAKFAA